MSYSLDSTAVQSVSESPDLTAIVTMSASVRDVLADLCIRAGSFDVRMIARIWNEAREHFTLPGQPTNAASVIRAYYHLGETGRLYQTS